MKIYVNFHKQINAQTFNLHRSWFVFRRCTRRPGAGREWFPALELGSSSRGDQAPAPAQPSRTSVGPSSTACPEDSTKQNVFNYKKNLAVTLLVIPIMYLPSLFASLICWSFWTRTSRRSWGRGEVSPTYLTEHPPPREQTDRKSENLIFTPTTYMVCKNVVLFLDYHTYTQWEFHRVKVKVINLIFEVKFKVMPEYFPRFGI